MSRPRRRCDVGSGGGKGADMTPRDEPIRPMTLGNMYQNGVRGLYVTCSACGHHPELNVDAWPDDVTDRRSARACVHQVRSPRRHRHPQLEGAAGQAAAGIITELRSMNESRRSEMKPLCDRYFGRRHQRWELLERHLESNGITIDESP